MPIFDVPDMSCGHCVKAIEKAVQAVDAEAKVDTDLETKKVSIASSASRASLADALTEAGYPPT